MSKQQLMSRFLYILCILILLPVSTVFGQQRLVEAGHEAFAKKEYPKAQKAYLKLISKGERGEDVLQRLGDAYYLVADYKNAANWYDSLSVYHPQMDMEHLFRFAQTLKSIKDYDRAKQVMLQYEAISGSNNIREEHFSSNRDYISKIKAQKQQYAVTSVSFNTKNAEFAPAFYGNSLVFAANGEDRNAAKHKHAWNNQPFFDLYTYNPETEKAKTFKGKINTRFHESTAVFTKDLQTVYFTRNNFTEGFYKQDSTGINRLKLYKGVRIKNNRWKIEELPFNSDEYSVAHPALNPDETELYFVSDMPGGFGQSDLYKVILGPEESSIPVNLGSAVNTEGRDTFPFINGQNQLYFSSDGHPGMGGLDLFTTTISPKGFGIVSNMGEPINSAQDDFTLIIDSHTQRGYFASNRQGGKGEDDIYSFAPIIK